MFAGEFLYEDMEEKNKACGLLQKLIYSKCAWNQRVVRMFV